MSDYAYGIPEEEPDRIKELITDIVWGGDSVAGCMLLVKAAREHGPVGEPITTQRQLTEAVDRLACRDRNEYVSIIWYESDRACLDGRFTAADLREIAALLDRVKT